MHPILPLLALALPQDQQQPVHREKPSDPPAAARALDDPTARSVPALPIVAGAVSAQVNVDGTGMNVLGDAANEPSIAVDPTDPARIVIGWRQFDSVTSNFRQAGWAYTTDAGATWTAGTIDPGNFRSDPVLEFDADGRVYYQSLTGNFTLDVFASTDAGQSWNNGAPSWGGDKNWMTIDKSGGSGHGFVYGIWQRFFSCCDPDTFTRSIDGGLTWQVPVEVDRYPVFGTMDVGPSGEVYAVGIDGTFGQDFDTFVLAKSVNAQNSGQTPTFSATVVDLGGSLDHGEDPNPGGLMGQANVAVDPTNGDVYVLCSVNPPGSDNADVRIARSTNGGVTFGASARVNDDASGSSRWQWFGTMDIAPNGRIDVIWNDTRNSGAANLSELFYAWSYDHGATWQGNIPVSPMFDSHLGWPNQDKLGDYYEIESDDGGASIAWAATFNGEQDVYYLRLTQDCTLSGPGTAFCFGDGSGAACPCGNGGAPGSGCANGANASGARLGACGSDSIAAADLRLVTTGAVPGQTGLYFQGDAAIAGGSGLPFRDGLRCAGGTVIRLETTSSDGDGASETTIDVAAKGAVSAGDTRHYQLWYRDPTGSPCQTGSNLSNGLTVVWQP